MNNRIFKDLEEIAIENVNTTKAKVAAAIMLNNKTLGIGINKNKSHTFQARYSKNKESIFLHAEIAAIHSATYNPWRTSLEGTTLYICRMRKINGIYVRGMAKPCEGCMKAIIEFDIGDIFYTTDEGTIERL